MFAGKVVEDNATPAGTLSATWNFARSYIPFAPIRAVTSCFAPFESTTTALDAPTKGCHGLIAVPSVPTKTPFEVAKIEPSDLNVVRLKTASAAFFTAPDCARHPIESIINTIKTDILLILIILLRYLWLPLRYYLPKASVQFLLFSHLF